MNKQLRELFKTDDPCATCNFRNQLTYNEPCISCYELENGEESNHCLDEEIEKVVEELEAKATAYDNAKEDIDKATPKKAVHECNDISDQYYCPVCYETDDIPEKLEGKPNYCQWCGQKLNWKMD